MVTIKKTDKRGTNEKYNVPEVAKAIGLSEGQVQAYFSNRGISTAGGYPWHRSMK